MQISPRTFKALVATAGLVLITGGGCKKTETTPPEGDQAQPAEEEEVEAAEPEPEEEDEGPAMLTKASFDETIQDHFQDVTDCYLGALEANAQLEGNMHLEFTISLEGTVAAVSVVEGATLVDEALVACVTEAAQSWQFDRPKEEMSLRYPFELAPG
jgi:TonB family protein